MYDVQIGIRSKNSNTIRGTFVDKGKVELLRSIDKNGSISGAAKELGITYKHAHTVVTQMNDEANHPLVVSTVGGDDGGGTFITDFARSLIQDYLTIYEALTKSLPTDPDIFKKYQQ